MLVALYLFSTPIFAESNSTDNLQKHSNSIQNTTQNSSNGWLTYTNQHYGFSLIYSRSWNINTTSPIPSLSPPIVYEVRFFVASPLAGISGHGKDDRVATLTVSAEAVGQRLDPSTFEIKSKSLYDYVQKEIDMVNGPSYSSGHGFEYYGNNPITIAGFPGWKVVSGLYAYDITPHIRLFINKFFVIHDNILFTIDFGGPTETIAQYVPAAQQMVSSFRFTK